MKLLFALVTVAAFSVAFSQVFIQCASNAAGLNGIVNRFRRCLGDPNNGNAQGNQGKGRREVSSSLKESFSSETLCNQISELLLIHLSFNMDCEYA